MKKTILLTFDDAVISQYELAFPLLRELGFGATFFVCRFGDAWRAANEKYLIPAEQLREMHDAGFEIANHSWSHPDFSRLTDEQAGKELDRLNDYLAGAGIPKPVSFAYPGGPYAANAVPVLKSRGFIAARSTERRTFNRKTDDPMNLPSWPMTGRDEEFSDAVSRVHGENTVTLLFHGVPEYVHPWCNTDFPVFERYMNYLKENDFRVLSIRDYLSEQD